MAKLIMILGLLVIACQLVLASDNIDAESDDDVEFFDANSSFEDAAAPKSRKRLLKLEEFDNLEDEENVETDSQLALIPSDDEEAAGLEGKKAFFQDYCVSTRDFLLADLGRLKDTIVTKIFKLFFKVAERIGIETLKIGTTAAQAMAHKVQNPISTSDMTMISTGDERVDQTIAEGQLKVGESKAVHKSIFHAILAILKAIGTSIANQIRARLDDIKNAIGNLSIVKALKGACSKIRFYQEEFDMKFAEVQEELVQSDLYFADLRSSDIDCLTAKRIRRLSRMCSIADVADSPLFQMLTAHISGNQMQNSTI